MPYIVTTRPNRRVVPTDPAVRRTAVATLDEARDSVVKITSDARGSLVAALGAISESGGTIGPLPDGTVIEVRAVECGCPDDCNCHHSWRTNYCGCAAHAS